MQEENSIFFDKKTELIDDYIYTILLLKTSDCSNRSLLFLQAHLIELLIKTTCDKLGLDYSKNHDLIGIGRLLATRLPILTSIIPTDEDLIKYRDVYIPGDDSQNTVHIQPPEMLDKYEMTLMMKHSVNLKYIYDKKGIATSNIYIAKNWFNGELRKLIDICRPIYTKTGLPKKILELW